MNEPSLVLGDSNLDGAARATYLLRYLNAETARIEARLQHVASIVTDGYYLRFLIKERVFAKLHYRQFTAGARIADARYCFIFLDLDPEACYERKMAGNHRITPYECTTPTKEGFLEFQTRQRAYLMEYIAKQTDVIRIDATATPSQVCRQTLTFLTTHEIHRTTIDR